MTRIAAVFAMLVLWVLPGCAQAQVTVEFWTMSLRPKFDPYMRELIARYERAHPGVRVDWVDYPWDVLQTKLVTRIVAGKPPALVNLNVPWAEEYVNDGLLLPVDDWMNATRQRYLPAAIEDLSFHGKVYGFPFYGNVAVMACNSALFKAANVQRVPGSLDEQLVVARRIARVTGKAGYAPLLGKPDGFMMQQGLPVIEHGRAVFNSPRHVALLRKLALAYREGALLKDSMFAEENFSAVIAAYKGGRLAMLVAPPTALTRIESEAPDIYRDTYVVAAPLGPTGIIDGGWLIHFAVPRGVKADVKLEAERFADFLTNDDNQLAFAKLANVFPTTRGAANDDYFRHPPGSMTPVRQAIAAGADAMKQARTLYVAGVMDYDELRRILVKAVESGVTGKADIATALDEAAAIWNRKLAETGAYVGDRTR